MENWVSSQPHKIPGQSLSVPTHSGLSSAVILADNRWGWSSHMSNVCAEKAADCFCTAQLWRSSYPRHGAHHQPARLVPPEGNQDVQCLLKCLIAFEEALVLTITPERSLWQLPRGLTRGHTKSPHQALQYFGESNTGAQLGCNPVDFTQESKMIKCGCQNCIIAYLAHETTPWFHHLSLNTLDITAGCSYFKSTLFTPQLYSGINFTPPWHGRQQMVTNTKHSVVKLGIVFINSLFVSHLLRQPALPHSDDNITLMQGLVITAFCHGHCLSHHTKWSLHEHQQVLGTGFLCTAWLSHSCGEWISVVPCKEAVLFQNKQKTSNQMKPKRYFSP